MTDMVSMEEHVAALRAEHGDWHMTYGHYYGDPFPRECIADCSSSGDVSKVVLYWCEKLRFSVPRELAIPWLQEYGAWTKEELREFDDAWLARTVLWLACCDLSESEEPDEVWGGLVH